MKNIEKLAEIGEESLYQRLDCTAQEIWAYSDDLERIKTDRYFWDKRCKESARENLFSAILKYRNIRIISRDCGLDASEFDDFVAKSLNLGKETVIPINRQGILELLGLNQEVRAA